MHAIVTNKQPRGGARTDALALYNSHRSPYQPEKQPSFSAPPDQHVPVITLVSPWGWHGSLLRISGSPEPGYTAVMAIIVFTFMLPSAGAGWALCSQLLRRPTPSLCRAPVRSRPAPVPAYLMHACKFQPGLLLVSYYELSSKVGIPR